jgi:hypothetical protein
MEYLKELTPSGVGFNQEEVDLYWTRLNGGSITPEFTDFRTFPSANGVIQSGDDFDFSVFSQTTGSDNTEFTILGDASSGNDETRGQHNAFPDNDETRGQHDTFPGNDDTRNLEIDHVPDPICALYIDDQGKLLGINSSATENERVRDLLNFVPTSLILCRLHSLPFISSDFFLTGQSYHSL